MCEGKTHGLPERPFHKAASGRRGRRLAASEGVLELLAPWPERVACLMAASSPAGDGAGLAAANRSLLLELLAAGA